MFSTSIAGMVPGLRPHGEQVISITASGAEGVATMAKLESFLGPCATDAGGDLVWATESLGDGTSARHFSGSPELMARVAHGVLIGDGVTAKATQVDLADCQLCGSGATMLMLSRSIPGLRQAASAFPEIPGTWAAAIESALQTGRFLRAGAGLPSSPAAPAPKVLWSTQSRGPASDPGARAKVPKRATRLDAGELARRSAIIAKHGIETDRARALVNLKIARGDPA